MPHLVLIMFGTNRTAYGLVGGVCGALVEFGGASVGFGGALAGFLWRIGASLCSIGER